MRNPSPKARHFIQAGIEQLKRREDLAAWLEWCGQHPSIDRSGARLPDSLARVVLRGLEALTQHINVQIESGALQREAKIALENDLGYVRDIEGEIRQDLRERV